MNKSFRRVHQFGRILGSKVQRFAVGASLMVGAVAAHAAVDTTVITAAKSDVDLVGAAVFAVMVGIAVWKWSRRAL